MKSVVSYIGFSQGTAQAFAALSTHPLLNDKINVFIALAPAMSPAGLRNGVVDALVKASPEVLFLAFGRQSLLSSTPMWQSILYPPIFVRLLDFSLSFLFKWSCKNIAQSQKVRSLVNVALLSSTEASLVGGLPSLILLHIDEKRGPLVPNHSQQELSNV